MKKIAYIIAIMVGVLGACTENEMTGAELKSASLLSVAADGSTSVKLTQLNAVLAGEETELSEEELAGLIWMREEEKLAGDLYQAFYGLYDWRIFGNISRSESTHVAAVLRLFDLFGIEDSTPDEVGVFANADIQKLYEDLKTSGEVSLVEALKVGAYVEELDILDLEERLEATSNADIQLVYENLLRGSRNHLRAFTRVLAQNDVYYQPLLLSDDYFNEIVEGAMERGSQNGNCALGYGYANRNGNNNRAQYNSEDCEGNPQNGVGGQQKRYRGGN
ncbi:DUF2202 domain-containing protein [Sunxiuqinia rutila]|uniref:DUF2202 domain-containing protein n=1 Tax=Sunxiuqinia rutila TaxID=1397841 RepID=UPI003D35EEE7